MLQVLFVPSVHETALCCVEGPAMSGAPHHAMGEHLGMLTTAGERASCGAALRLPGALAPRAGAHSLSAAPASCIVHVWRCGLSCGAHRAGDSPVILPLVVLELPVPREGVSGTAVTSAGRAPVTIRDVEQLPFGGV